MGHLCPGFEHCDGEWITVDGHGPFCVTWTFKELLRGK
jgi:hypothetical protein